MYTVLTIQLLFGKHWCLAYAKKQNFYKPYQNEILKPKQATSQSAEIQFKKPASCIFTTLKLWFAKHFSVICENRVRALKAVRTPIYKKPASNPV